MNKIKVKIIAIVLSVLIAISSLSIVSVSAAETTSTNTSSNASDYFTESDLEEFFVTLSLYHIKRDLHRQFGKSEAQIDSIVKFPDDKYIVRNINSTSATDDTDKTNLSGQQLEKLYDQLYLYFATKKLLESGIVTIYYNSSDYDIIHKFMYLFSEKENTIVFPPEVINNLVKFPSGIVIRKLPDEKNPNGLVFFRDCLPPEEYKLSSDLSSNELNDKLEDIIKNLMLKLAYSVTTDCLTSGGAYCEGRYNIPGTVYKDSSSDLYYYFDNSNPIRQSILDYYQTNYGDNWESELRSDLDAILLH